MFSSSKKLSATSLPSLRDETSRVHAHAQSPGRGAAIALQFGATHEPRVAATAALSVARAGWPGSARCDASPARYLARGGNGAAVVVMG